ncbi:hypothetical protein D3C87_1333020 [compost metagenome]
MSLPNQTDNILNKIKNNKIIAICIVLSIVITALITFWEKVEPTYYKIANLISPPEAYTSFDYIKEQFDPDTLKAKRRLKGMVARRDLAMYYIIPTDWDIDEPLDGPGGLKYQTYILPNNPACMISASAEISCFGNLIDAKDSVTHMTVKEQQSVYKKLSGYDDSAKDGGYCSLEETVEQRIAEARKDAKKFKLYYISPAHRTFQKSNGETYSIESRRFKYSFEIKGQKFYVMDIVAYMDDITFKLEFAAPAEDYIKHEASFIEISNNMYFTPLL